MSRSTPTPPSSCLTTISLIAVGVVVGIALTIGIAGGALAVVLMTTPAATIALPAPEPPVSAPRPEATPNPTPAPNPTAAPRPTGTPSAARYDARIAVTEPYLSGLAIAGLAGTPFAEGFDQVTVDVQPGNVVVVTAFPRGARDFGLTLTGQLGLVNGRVAFSPVSSSLLLSPFRADIARTIEQAVNQRIDELRRGAAFQIVGLSTTANEVIVDIVFR